MVDSGARLVTDDAGAAAHPPRLDRGTLLVPGPSEGWAVKVYPSAGEAVVWRQGTARAAEGPELGPDRPPAAILPAGGNLRYPPGDAAAENRARATRRARSRARRFAVANRCVILATFTYGGPDRPTFADRARVKRDWARMARDLRALYPGLAWLRVLEQHKSGHLHVHVAFNRAWPSEKRDRALARLWGHGFVDLTRIRGHQGGGGREAARVAARYLSKYIGKDLADSPPGEHAYEVAQGFQPAVVLSRAFGRELASDEAVRAMGGELPAYEWDSRSALDWRGPPVLVLGW